MRRYLCAAPGLPVLRRRLDRHARIDTLDYGEQWIVNGVRVSLHPAGHILGSAQVRVEKGGEVWVVTGDYKTEPDPTCAPYEPVRCHTFITECTFGLPIYRWPAQAHVFAEIERWWRQNQEAGRASVLMGYSLGKSQRALAGLNPEIGPIYAHGAIQRMNEAYREAGVPLPPCKLAVGVRKGHDWSRALILAPPSALGTPWARRFGDFSTAFASGWMLIRGTRRRRALDRGFVLSDHVDWPALVQAVNESGAERVWCTHGYSNVVARYFAEQGLDTAVVPTRWEGEQDIGGEEADKEAAEADEEAESSEAGASG
jgi:putative mRNA 3-end processing factor